MKKPAASSFSIALTGLALCLALPAQAQYMDFRSDKPGIELDLDVLNDLSPRAPEKDTQQQAAPPLRYVAPAPTPVDVMEAPPASPVPTVEQAPRKMHKPLFAAPIAAPIQQKTKPAPQQQPRPVTAPAPAARKPYNPYLTAPVAAPQPARSIYAPEPVVPKVLPREALDNLPAAARPTDDYLIPPPRPQRKPDIPTEAQIDPVPVPAAAALPAAPKTGLSYPPSKAQKAPVQHFARPVLPAPRQFAAPQALPEEVIPEAEIAETPVTLPVQKPAMEAITETETALPKAAPSLPLRKPLNVLVQTAPDDTAQENIVTSNNAADDEKVALPTPPPARVFTRPSLITTDAPAPTRPVLKKAEVTMPVSATDFEKIAVNMERVPVQVAIAPPKPARIQSLSPSAADMTLVFDRVSESLNDTAQEKLHGIIQHMTADETSRLQIRAYASGEDGSKLSARSKSLTRATEVRSFLMDNGIKPTRVIVRALGQETDRKPLDRVDLIFMP